MPETCRVVLTEEAAGALVWLAAEESARIRRSMELVSQRGWPTALETGLVRPLRRRIYELRILGHGAAYRLTCFPAFTGGVATVVIVDCVPKSHWKLRQVAAYIARAERVRREWSQ